MSHPGNESYLEYAKNEFEAATTREEREAVIQRLRDEGFNAAALVLEQYVEDGMSDSLTHDTDRSDELREQKAFEPEPRQSGAGEND